MDCSIRGVYDGVNNPQHSGYGINAQLLVGKRINKFSWLFGPFINYWWINDSETRTIETNSGKIAITEPQNDTLDVGLMFRFIF